ncbi:methyltransferase-domain-containing protein [Pilobolus umbonatus]|nr:methyltransferase-domain-containing protein [Pilobolus umbonatus]
MRPLFKVKWDLPQNIAPAKKNKNIKHDSTPSQEADRLQQQIETVTSGKRRITEEEDVVHKRVKKDNTVADKHLSKKEEKALKKAENARSKQERADLTVKQIVAKEKGPVTINKKGDTVVDKRLSKKERMALKRAERLKQELVDLEADQTAVKEKGPVTINKKESEPVTMNKASVEVIVQKDVVMKEAGPTPKKEIVTNKQKRKDNGGAEQTPSVEKKIQLESGSKKNDVKKKDVKMNQKKKLQQLLAKKKAPVENKPAAVHKQVGKQEVKMKQKVVPKAQPQEADDGLTPLQRKMKEKLSGARFRWLNEQLYTSPGKQSFSLFQEKPELFDEYHSGYRHQVESWPENPVDIIINQLKSLPYDKVIADLGCGDAMIAQTLTDHEVLSFDLVAKNELVTACDIAKLPLKANSVDVVVFSLSLMGTNYVEFLKEAHRILKVGGELKIAEVVSRFTDLDAFIELLESMGFEFLDKDEDNKMFIMLYFTKQEAESDDEVEEEMLKGLSKTQKRSLKKGVGINSNQSKLQKKAQQILKPCLYKKR